MIRKRSCLGLEYTVICGTIKAGNAAKVLLKNIQFVGLEQFVQCQHFFLRPGCLFADNNFK